MQKLYKAYANRNLTDTLKGLNDEELEMYLKNIFLDDIIGDRINILIALRNEEEYRESDRILKSKTR